MSKFSAGSAVEPMEYDFTDYGGSSGVIPEPSNQQLNTFFRTMGQLAQELRGLLPNLKDADQEDPEALAKLFDNMDDLDAVTSTRITEALAAVCSNQPSAEEIAALPWRVQQAFSGWIVGELRPEGGSPATKR